MSAFIEVQQQGVSKNWAWVVGSGGGPEPLHWSSPNQIQLKWLSEKRGVVWLGLLFQRMRSLFWH